jgi:hypothetical protein
MIFPVELLGVGIAHSGAHCKIHCQRGFQNYQGCILVGSHRDCEDHIAVCRYDPCSLALSLMTRATHHGPFGESRKDGPAPRGHSKGLAPLLSSLFHLQAKRFAYLYAKPPRIGITLLGMGDGLPSRFGSRHKRKS